MSLDRLGPRLEAAAREVAAEQYQFLRDPARAPRMAEVLETFRNLFHPEQIAEVERAATESAEDRARRARFALAFLLRGRATLRAGRATDRRSAALRDPVVQAGERRLPLRTLAPALTAEADPSAPAFPPPADGGPAGRCPGLDGWSADRRGGGGHA